MTTEPAFDHAAAEPIDTTQSGLPIPARKPAALVRASSPLDEIRELVAYLEDLKTVCESLCKATILPPYMQQPANLQLVLMQGLSMGFTVPQAIRASFIIPPKKEGEVPRVGYYVDSLIALVRRSEKCRFFRIETTTADAHRVICARTDEGTDTAPIIHMFELTRQQAHEAGMDIARWKDRDGRWQTGIKHNWETGPADMLNARNCGRAVKRVFQDVVFGMATPEELEDIAIADRQEGEVFASIPRAAMTARRADSPAVVHIPKESSEPIVVPAGAPEDPARTDITPAPATEGSGDLGWDAVLEDIARLAGVDTSGWLPDDLLELWNARLAACSSKGTITLLTPWLGNVGSHVSQSKTCSEVFAKMREAFNARDKEIKQQARAAAAVTNIGGAS